MECQTGTESTASANLSARTYSSHLADGDSLIVFLVLFAGLAFKLIPLPRPIMIRKNIDIGPLEIEQGAPDLLELIPELEFLSPWMLSLVVLTPGSGGCRWPDTRECQGFAGRSRVLSAGDLWVVDFRTGRATCSSHQ